jgi:tetratricopeptide (TPR) repeat protein
MLKRYKEALDAFNKAIELDPQNADAWYNKGVVLELMGKTYAAEDSYSKAIKIDPLYAELRK